MTESIAIRQASAEDAATLIELRERMLLELDRMDDERLAQLASLSLEWMAAAFPSGHAHGWLAENNGRVIGGVSMSIIETQPQYRSLAGRIASIWGLFVEPESRGAQVATRLVEAAVEHARSMGIDLVTLHAADKARPIYERIGFTATSEMRLFLTDEAREA